MIFNGTGNEMDEGRKPILSGKDLAAAVPDFSKDILVRQRKGKFKILGVCGSPRKSGNTQTMLETALEAAREQGAETELILLSGKDVRPCDACESCQKTHRCHIKDDMQDIFPKLWEADGIIIGTPTYGLSITAQIKSFLDRSTGFHSDWFTSEAGGIGFRRTVGAFVVVAGHLGASLASMNLLAEFAFGRWIFAGGVWVYAWDKGDVKNNEESLKQAQDLGNRVYQFVNQWSKP
jgi:multimeric flavodoxin WrbA